MNWGRGETITHYAFCKYDDCGYVTDDYESVSAAESDILEHLEDDHEEADHG